MRIIRQSEFKATPWKNGGGITHEAIRVPASGDPFRWRVSVAHIEKSGPFSEFAAYNRIMVLLEGSGAALKFATGDQRLLRAVGDVVQFDGAIETRCELTNGPCMDLNLMVAKSLHGVDARVERLRQPSALPATRGRATLIFPIDAAVALKSGGGDMATLEPWDLAVISYSAGGVGLASNAPSNATSAPGLVFLATLPDP
jgi:environmental stress-induced protein Ves